MYAVTLRTLYMFLTENDTNHSAIQNRQSAPAFDHHIPEKANNLIWDAHAQFACKNFLLAEIVNPAECQTISKQNHSLFTNEVVVQEFGFHLPKAF